MSNVLSEYLVRLSFESSDPSLAKFTGMLRTAEEGVTRYTGGMTKKVLEAQFAIVGAFTGISSAILGLVDKVAMADLGYQKTAIRMMMTKESARSLDMVTKALGASLEEIWWTPELRERAGEMLKHLGKMNQMLGPDFDKNMKSVRDMRQQFSLFEMDLKFLGMSFANDLFKQLFPDGGKAALNWLSGKLAEFEKNIPAISKALATYAVPILKDTWKILLGLGEVLKTGALAFTNFISIFSGAKPVDDAAFSFKNFAGALESVANFLVRIETWATNAELAIAHLAASISLLAHGDFAGAGDQFLKAKDAGTPHSALSTEVGIAAGLYGANKAIGLAKWGGRALGLGRIAGWLGMGGGAAEAAGAVEGGAAAAGGIGVMGAASIAALPLAAAAALIVERKHVKSFSEWRFADSPLAKMLGMGSSAAAPADIGTPTSSLTGALGQAITEVEAGKGSNPLSTRNNNPGNLRSWGATPIAGGFAQFSTPEAGRNALYSQINKNIGRGLTLNEFFAGGHGYGGYAPAGDKNDPSAYAARVAKQLGIDPNVPLNRIASVNPAASGAAASGVRQSVDVGGVSVFITQPAAGVQDIQRAVNDGIADALKRQSQFDIAQMAPAWG